MLEKQYEYNCAGQFAKMTDPLENSKYYWYDAGNRLNRMQDRNGMETTYTYNMYGSLTSRTARNPSKPDEAFTETYQYTPEGRLHAAISTTGMRYGYEYDIMGRLARKTASGRELLSYAYDLNGNLVRQKDITGKITFLGFTHYCSKSRNGKFRVKRKTSRKKSAKKCREVHRETAGMRILPAAQITKKLDQILTGYYHYYGITDNFKGINDFCFRVRRSLFYWLNRRSQKKSYTWEAFNAMLKDYPLARPKIYVSIYR